MLLEFSLSCSLLKKLQVLELPSLSNNFLRDITQNGIHFIII